MKRYKKSIITLCTVLVMLVILMVSVAASGDVAGAVENTWDAAKGQIKTVTNNVIFPVIDLILAILYNGLKNLDKKVAQNK